MEKFQVGDFVTVLNPSLQCGKKFSKVWVKNYARKYLDFLSTDDISKEDQNAYQIKQLSYIYSAESKCLIQNVFSRNCYLINISGIKHKYNKVSEGDVVKVFDFELVYPDKKFWLEKNAPDLLDRADIKVFPCRTNNYIVTVVAPKADFAPLNKDNLVLIINPKNGYIFLVEEKGLWLCEKE